MILKCPKYQDWFYILSQERLKDQSSQFNLTQLEKHNKTGKTICLISNIRAKKMQIMFYLVTEHLYCKDVCEKKNIPRLQILIESML